MSEAHKKIAILGCEGIRSTDPNFTILCMPWNDLSALTNVRDYDIVILNLIDNPNTKSLDWPTFRDQFDFVALCEILRGDGVIFILGNPRVYESSLHRVTPDGREVRVPASIVNWLNVSLSWDVSSGTSASVVGTEMHDGLLSYCNLITRWTYALKPEQPNLISRPSIAPFISSVSGNSVVPVVVPLCKNRAGYYVAFSLFFRIVHARKVGHSYETSEIMVLGPIHFLPTIGLSGDDTVRRVLSDIVGVPTSQDEPAWLAAFVAPGQQPIDASLQSAMNQIANLQSEVERLQRERLEVRRPLAVLYEIGGPLEHVVWEMLESLGATVHRPADRTADGRVEVMVDGQPMFGVLEAKGTTRDVFNAGGLRQLGEWKVRVEVDHGVAHKAIFVGNSAIGAPPDSRDYPFVLDFIDRARLLRVCAIDSRTLYRAFELHFAGQLDLEEFWKQVFSTDGPIIADQLPAL